MGNSKQTAEIYSLFEPRKNLSNLTYYNNALIMRVHGGIALSGLSFSLFNEQYPVAFYSIKIHLMVLQKMQIIMSFGYMDITLSYRYNDQRQMTVYTVNGTIKVG